jgi:hypothetical protein
VFFGFNPHQKGYRCYHPSAHHMYVSMDVTFFETEYFFGLDQSTSSPQGEQLGVSKKTEKPNKPRKPKKK